MHGMTQHRSGTDVAIEWHGHRAVAWMPAPLAARDSELRAEAVRSTERAAAEVRRVGDRLPRGWEPLARLLLRAEGIASSNIEGLRAPVTQVVAAEAGDTAEPFPAAWVADNLAVVVDALDHAHTDEALGVGDLHRWHERLMDHSGMPEDLVGAFRASQGWIGGRGPQDAAYVPPPPDAIDALMDDLLDFLSASRTDAVAEAAIAHAQFVTIHPYDDGNGRIGRLLALWVLARRLSVAVPPPISVMIARDPGGYLSGLHAFRVGEHGQWIEWFATVVARAADASLRWADEVDAVLEDWRARVTDTRADAAARAVLDLLPAHPVVSVDIAATCTGVSATAARGALETLAARGVLEEFQPNERGPGRPRRWWIARGLVDLIGRWEA
jgi:Fic family protein